MLAVINPFSRQNISQKILTYASFLIGKVFKENLVSFYNHTYKHIESAEFRWQISEKLAIFHWILFTSISTQQVLPMENGWFVWVKGHPTANGGRDFLLGDCDKSIQSDFFLTMSSLVFGRYGLNNSGTAFIVAIGQWRDNQVHDWYCTNIGPW